MSFRLEMSRDGFVGREHDSSIKPMRDVPLDRTIEVIFHLDQIQFRLWPSSQLIRACAAAIKHWASSRINSNLSTNGAYRSRSRHRLPHEFDVGCKSVRSALRITPLVSS